MSAPSTVEELLQLIRKSGMVDEQKLGAYLQRRQAGRGLPSDPREAADALLQDGLITGFQAEQFLLGKWRGFTIGKYKLLERVGVGGMGQVFLCEHTFMKRRVAIKVLPPAKAEQPAALGRFYREARAAGSIEHPNIVRTHDIDQDGNLHFIVMEYVDGSNLLDVTKKFGPMDIRRAASYVHQVAMGLEFAFRNGIIHRDIKPGNILIDRRGHAKLLDMGLARFYNDHSDNLTVKYDDKIVLGTADYVAPEQVANSHGVDIRADVYALGASFYFMLAGHPAFPTGTVSQKLLWHRTKDPTPIRLVRSDVPEDIAAIVTKMMQKDPARRYQTPAEVAEALEPWIQGPIPMPAMEEMPALSPAALEGEDSELVAMKQVPIEHQPQPASVSVRALQAAKAAVSRPSMAGIGSLPLSEMRSKSVVKPSPFAPQSDQETPMEPHHPPTRGGHPAPSRPTTSTRNSHAEMPTAQNSKDLIPTQANPTRQTHQNLGMFPVIAMPPTNESTDKKKIALIALVGLSLLLAVGLLGWKMGAKSRTAPPAPVQEVQPVASAKPATP